MAESLSTAPPLVPRERIRQARNLRRGFFVLVSLIVAAAVAGLLGASADVATGSGGGYQLEVEHPRVTRPGLSAAVTVTIRRDGGFGPSVMLAFSSGYFDVFDVNGIDPEPVGETTTADRQLALFQAPPSGDEMSVSFDARIQPGVPLTRAKGSVAIVEDGRDVVSVSFQTLVMP